eukprot:TRINITY_DN38225_c0_g1_i1.p1 TRINITY_DN38225_c0_g1~~TRINITY_DN38225_c0_g1_i1.p1  ORF type:complete len:734 (+),score=185.12 TRINITY_DN38225_c0_g1_i1:66-2267(+)
MSGGDVLNDCDDETPLERRSEIRAARSCLKQVRGLCKEYKMGFKMPGGGVFDGSTRRDSNQASLGEIGRHAGEDAESPSSSDLSSEEDKAGLGNHTEWPTIRELLDGIQPEKRVDELSEISIAMNASANKARQQLETLDALEEAADKKRAEISLGSEGDDEVSDSEFETDPLLSFKAAQIPAAQALRRCIAVVPELRDRAKDRIEALEAAKAEAAKKRESDSGSDSGEKSEPYEAEEGLARDVAKKMQQYGGLPPHTDHELHRVLEAQKVEIRSLVQRIVEGEKEVQVKRTATDYIDGRLNLETCDKDLLAAAMSVTNDLKASLLAERRREAEETYQKQRSELKIPSEEEVAESILECERLQNEVDMVVERVKKLQELDVKLAQQQKEALQDETVGAVVLDIPLDEAVAAQSRLLQEVKDLNDEMATEDKRIEASETLIHNAEKTLRTLEETKTVFLEQIAKERPELVANLIGMDLNDQASSDDEAERGLTIEENGLNEDECQSMLAAEERWLRTQLAEVQGTLEDFEMDYPLDGSTLDQKWADDPLIGDIKKLVERVKRAEQRARAEKLDHSVDGEETDGESVSSSASEGELTSAQAIEQLRSLPHGELMELMRVRKDNKRLLQAIQDEQDELNRLRAETGAPEELLRPSANSSTSLPVGVDKTLVDDVRRKCRELDELRKRWWSDRQDPMTTVRRALAATDLPENADDDDEPPTSVQASLFERIHASMTLP